MSRPAACGPTAFLRLDAEEAATLLDALVDQLARTQPFDDRLVLLGVTCKLRRVLRGRP